MQTTILEEIKKTIVFFGSFIKKPGGEVCTSLSGTGFLMCINNIFMIATAKHVIFSKDSSGNQFLNQSLHIFNNSKRADRTIRASSIQELYKNGARCFIHDNKAVDLAILTFNVSPEDDIKTFDKNMFMGLETINELEDVFFMSFQPGISNLEADDKVHPIIRKGIVSRINKNVTTHPYN